MTDKKLIAESLLEIAKRAETTFIDVVEDKELIDAAEKVGITLPSPDFLIMKTIYAEINKANLNGVILSKEAVEQGLPTLLFKQCNWEHEGSGRVCGFTISAKINEDKVETINVLFKSLFPEEIAELKEKIQNKQAAVSFEIWNRNPETGKSVVTELDNGNRSINPIIFHGTGVLLVNPPACPKAKIFKMIGKQEVIDKLFEEDLIYASAAVIEPKCQNCKTCTCDQTENKGGKNNIMAEEIIIEEEILDFEDDYDGGEIEEAKKITTKQRNELPDSDFALIQHVGGKKVRRFPIHDEAHVRNALARLPQAKGLSDAERKSAMNKILRKAKALNMTELLKRHEKALEEALAEEVVVMPVGDVPVKLLDKGKKYCKGCQTELTQEEMEFEECALCKTKVKPEPAQVTDPTPVVEKKPEEQAQVVVTPEVAHDAPIETVTQKPERKLLQTITEDEETVTLIDNQELNSHQRKGVRKVTYIFDDGTSEVSTQDYDVTDTYTQAQLEAKALETQEELIAALPKEVTDCVKEQIKDGKKPTEAVKHCWAEYKKVHEKAIVDVVNEKDNKIQTIQKELDTKNQEIATLTVEKAKVAEQKAEPELTVGNVEIKDNELKREADNINKIIASKHDQK